MDQPEAFILARSLLLAKSELNCHSTQETHTRVESEMLIHLWGGNSQFTKYWHSTQDTKTKVQSELPRGVWGGRSQNVGTPPHQSSLGVYGVGIHKMLALHPRHRHPGTIRAPQGSLGWAFPNCGHSTPYTNTKVQSELLRGLWGGHSHLWALHPIHRHQGTIRAP